MLNREYAGCVYVATNSINGRSYIGKTKMPLLKRIRCHKSAAVNGGSMGFHGAIRKYGFEAFRWNMLFVSECEAALYDAERELIAAARDRGERLYNRSDGGEGATGAAWTSAARKKLSDTTKGRTFSPETRARLSAALKGKAKSPEHTEKMRAAKTGSKIKPWTPERRAKMQIYIDRARGTKKPPEVIEKMREGGRRRYERPGEREKARLAGIAGAAVRWGKR